MEQTTHIIGHHDVQDRLRQWHANEALPHAMLFVGPRSVGKRRIADWLANLLVDDHTEHVITLEDDALQIDAIRDVRRRAALSASSVAPTVVILDGINRMRAPAANALLKTLEEPRGTIFFLLIAHGDGSDVLPTIRSRSTIVRCRPLPPEDIAKNLREHYDCDEDTALRLAQQAGGAPGRALQLLDTDNATEETETEMRRALRTVVGEPLAQRFAFVKDTVDADRTPLVVAEGLRLFRDVMLFQEGCDDLVMRPDEMEETEAGARRITPGRLRSGLQRLLQVERLLMTTTINRRLALERALLDF